MGRYRGRVGFSNFFELCWICGNDGLGAVRIRLEITVVEGFSTLLWAGSFAGS